MNAVTSHQYAHLVWLIALFRSVTLASLALAKGLISTLLKVSFGASILIAIVVAKLLPAAVTLALVRRLC